MATDSGDGGNTDQMAPPTLDLSNGTVCGNDVDFTNSEPRGSAWNGSLFRELPHELPFYDSSHHFEATDEG